MQAVIKNQIKKLYTVEINYYLNLKHVMLKNWTENIELLQLIECRIN